MAHKIGPECIGCGACAGECPTGCIHEAGGVYEINAAECIDCGTCAGACPILPHYLTLPIFRS